MWFRSMFDSLKSHFACAPARSTGRRASRRQGARLLLEALEDRLVPSTITVQNLNDSGPGSLRQAILDANANPGEDVIRFDPKARDGTITLTGGELRISDSLTIDGPGEKRLTVSGNSASRVFNISGNATNVKIDGLTIADGLAPGTTVVGPKGPVTLGGGVLNTGANVTLTDVALVGCVPWPSARTARRWPRAPATRARSSYGTWRQGRRGPLSSGSRISADTDVAGAYHLPRGAVWCRCRPASEDRHGTLSCHAARPSPAAPRVRRPARRPRRRAAGLRPDRALRHAAVDGHSKKDCPTPRGVKELCGPSNFPGTSSKLFHNLGPGADGQPARVRFQDVSLESGLGKVAGRAGRHPCAR